MNSNEFREWSLRAAEWGADYRSTLRERPVRPLVEPGEISRSIEVSPPEHGETMQAIFADFERKILPGMTHWQHPRFFAYFPANAAPVSVVAEYLVSVMAAQCMLWQTSPAATELETRVVDWMRQALGLPEGFSGVMQDSASSATLAAVLTMRERALDWQGNKKGLQGQPILRVYSSDQVHISIDRAIWVSGVGEDNLVRIPVAGRFRAMDVAALEAAVVADWQAMICPEYRHFWAGVEQADSIVFNPHKWLGAQFDCSMQFIRRPEDLVRTLAIKPDYLETHGRDGIINYSEWSVPLGRRFRALKLWFLLRAHGLENLRTMIRNHVAWGEGLAERLAREADFEIVSEPMLSLFSFRHLAAGIDSDEHNLRLVNAINDDGRIYLTQTRVDGQVAIRFQVGQFETTAADVDTAFEVITEIARRLA
ncbi:MAG: aspartate aminotransferase family protein [Mesorhizobium sp.]|uniref:pyridoxal phosphate-dependent decarboxylase family protein n=1 Tax=Mesorhizobium sp. TaxID=1871066 RepID=UPI000FE4BF09|nr:pyridoxal-dependent decarboxylase [Mesorhizobium sp.]RWP18640.1 MAG: aspartate aminotransferase family protein [Mesorhizobium sp.]